MGSLSFGMIASAFSAGLLSFFSPCTFPLLPVYIGYFASDDLPEETPYRTRLISKLLKTLLFVAGICVVFVLLGFGAGAIGKALSSVYFTIACGIIVFIFGLQYAEIINIPFLMQEKRFDMSKAASKGIWWAFLLGVMFSFGWTPCVGPVLATVLGMTAQNGDVLQGGILLFIYALGLSIPFLVLSAGSATLIARIKGLTKYLPIIKKIGGVIIALMGLWMIFSSISAVAPDNSGNNESSPNNNMALEEFILPAMNGDVVTLSDYRGKPVYIDFWTTWCPYCIVNIQEFNSFANRINAGDNYVVLSVVTPGYYREMSEEKLREWVAEQNLDFPMLLDYNVSITRHYGINTYPTGVYIAPDGQLAEIHVGYSSLSVIESKLEALK
jgi:cytochrome c biogenesis protein CcdA/peroxiredoxin